ncbi:MAG: hypothetical protein WDM81_13810 [Rhizomicrobium sp.]
MIFHAVDRLYVGKEVRALGVHDGFVYGKARRSRLPLFDAGVKAMEELYQVLRSWSWVRGDTDAQADHGRLRRQLAGRLRALAADDLVDRRHRLRQVAAVRVAPASVRQRAAVVVGRVARGRCSRPCNTIACRSRSTSSSPTRIAHAGSGGEVDAPCGLRRRDPARRRRRQGDGLHGAQCLLVLVHPAPADDGPGPEPQWRCASSAP